METYSIYPVKQMEDNHVLALMQRMQDEVWISNFLTRAEVKAKQAVFKKCAIELRSRGYELHHRARKQNGQKIGCDWSISKVDNPTYVYYRPKETYHNNQCTTRAMSVLFPSKGYMEIRHIQDAKARRWGVKWNSQIVTGDIMNDEGFALIEYLRERSITCGQIAEVFTGMRGVVRMAGHVAAFAYGKVYDSFDCTNRYARAVFVPKGMEETARKVLSYWNAI